LRTMCSTSMERGTTLRSSNSKPGERVWMNRRARKKPPSHRQRKSTRNTKSALHLNLEVNPKRMTLPRLRANTDQVATERIPSISSSSRTERDDKTSFQSTFRRGTKRGAFPDLGFFSLMRSSSQRPPMVGGLLSNPLPCGLCIFDSSFCLETLLGWLECSTSFGGRGIVSYTDC